MKTAHQFHLFYEMLRQAGHANTALTGTGPGVDAASKLELPHEPARLDLHDGDNPRLVRLDTAAVRGSLIVEPILTRSHQARLLLVSAGDVALTVNGEFAPRIALLKERDQFQLDHTLNFLVAVFHQPRIGPPPAELHGAPCPVCLVPFTPKSRCYVCHCGCALHLEGEPHEADKLQCARVWTECRCHRPVILAPCYSVPPTFEP